MKVLSKITSDFLLNSSKRQTLLYMHILNIAEIEII